MGLAQRAIAIDFFEAGSVDCQSSHSAYSCASSEPSFNKATNRSIPPAILTVIRLSDPPSAAMSCSAAKPRCRTSGFSSPSKMMSCAVTCTRC